MPFSVAWKFPIYLNWRLLHFEGGLFNFICYVKLVKRRTSLQSRKVQKSETMFAIQTNYVWSMVVKNSNWKIFETSLLESYLLKLVTSENIVWKQTIKILNKVLSFETIIRILGVSNNKVVRTFRETWNDVYTRVAFRGNIYTSRERVGGNKINSK